jgi:DHA3 family multidrug efflux protein-like MFS transporter
MAVLAGNIRGIALPTIIKFLVPEKNRDKANGLAGTASGVAFLIVSVISGLLVGASGMYWVLLLAIIFTALAIVNLWMQDVEEKKIVHLDEDGKPQKIDIKGTIKAMSVVPGLLPLIFFTTFNNFLGGVFMSLMDAYGLSLVSVQVWGIIWGVLSTAFIVGGIVISKWGVGKNPVRSLFITNIIIWTISALFTINGSIISLMIGMFLYLCVMPFIEASEQTIIQKVVPKERLGRVFGFAQSVEQSASPIMAFVIGPIAQFITIPYMTNGAGVQLIGSWFGTGPERGIALVFTIAGILGLTLTLVSMSTKYYRQLSEYYLKSKES